MIEDREYLEREDVEYERKYDAAEGTSDVPPTLQSVSEEVRTETGSSRPQSIDTAPALESRHNELDLSVESREVSSDQHDQ